MAQNITIWGATYSNVPGVQLPKQGGGTALFSDASVTTADDPDVTAGKTYLRSDGSIGTGTGSGGGSIYPTFTVVTDPIWGTITSITCNKPFSACFDLADNGEGAAIATYAIAGYSLGLSGWTDYDDQLYIQYSTIYDENGDAVDIKFNADGTIVTVPSAPSASGEVYDPVATKGAVSNHSVAVTPSVAFDGGMISSGSKTGTPVTVSASELVSGSETKTANGTYDVTNLASLVVNVSGGSGKNAQIAYGVNRASSTAYTAVTGQSITVAKTGTYDVYWCGWRSSTSGTNGSQLYIGNNAYGTANTTFDGTLTNCQIVHLSGVSLTKDQVVTVRARSRGNGYYMYIYNLTIIEA